jgi:uncharacterized membrane protein
MMRGIRLEKAYSALNSRRGETLAEGIVSMLIFTILIAMVTLTIMVSLRITLTSTQDAEGIQDSVNTLLAGGGTADEDIDGITFRIIRINQEDHSAAPISLTPTTVTVAASDDEFALIAFTP